MTTKHDTADSSVAETENQRVRKAALVVSRRLDKLSEHEQGRVLSVLCEMYQPGAGVRREA